MNPDLQALADTVKSAQNPFSLLLVATVVGGLVRILKTKKVSEILDALPFTSSVPKEALPWMAVAIAFVLSTVDAKLNGHLAWYPALVTGLFGAILSGGTAIGGHETIAKLVGLLSSGNGSTPSGNGPTYTVPPISPKPPGSARAFLVGAAFAAFFLVSSCAPFRDPKTATKTVLSFADIACLEAGDGAGVVDPKAAAKICHIVDAADEIAPELLDIVTKLIGQREAGKKAGFLWLPEGVTETKTTEAGAPKEAGVR